LKNAAASLEISNRLVSGFRCQMSASPLKNAAASLFEISCSIFPSA
jgi:hypothetical protein